MTNQRISEIRAQIAAGTYETDERIDGAVDRLLAELDVGQIASLLCGNDPEDAVEHMERWDQCD